MSDVAAARAVLQAGIMRDSVYILRTATIDDGGGGTYPDPAGPTATGPIVGAFSRQSGRELIASSQQQQRGTYRLALPVTTDIRETDQVAYQGKLYSVVFCPPLTALNLSRVVELEEAGGAWTPPVTSGSSFFAILTEDGRAILTEDGRAILMESIATTALLAEDGRAILTEDGRALLIEA